VKLLFDQMLPPILTKRLSDLFQDSEHIRNLGMARAPDTDVWEFAKKMGYGIVTKEGDFANLSLVWGAPRRSFFFSWAIAAHSRSKPAFVVGRSSSRNS
jgi:predicted nuclease of predicted toxin-antitoxin system